MIITKEDLLGITELKQFPNSQFEIKDLVQLSYFLGLEVSFHESGYYLSQAKYATYLLSHASLMDDKACNTPLKANVKLSPTNGSISNDHTLYKQLVWSFIYLTMYYTSKYSTCSACC